MNDHIPDPTKMIDTPRMHSALLDHPDAGFAKIWQVGCDIEFELNTAQERIKRLEEFVNRFFDPEDLGYVVSTVVRDDAREAIGMKRVESGSRVSMI